MNTSAPPTPAPQTEAVALVYINSVAFLMIVAVSIAPFIGLVVTQFDEIVGRYHTVSSYCSDPTRYGNRFLIVVTAIVGMILASTFVQEYNSLTHRSTSIIVRFFMKLVSALVLPLVGIFYTRGSGQTHYDFGFCQLMPIMWSEAIHTSAAMYYLALNGAFNIWYSVDMLRAKNYYSTATPQVLLTLSVIGTSAFALFMVLQIWIRLLSMMTPQDEKYDVICSSGAPIPSMKEQILGPTTPLLRDFKRFGPLVVRALVQTADHQKSQSTTFVVVAVTLVAATVTAISIARWRASKVEKKSTSQEEPKKKLSLNMANESWPLEVEREFSSESALGTPSSDSSARLSALVRSLSLSDSGSDQQKSTSRIDIPKLRNLPLQQAESPHKNTGPFSVFSSKFLSKNIFQYLSAGELLRLSATSKRFFVFIDGDDDLWQKHVFRRYKGYFHWMGSWKRTCFRGEELSKRKESDTKRTITTTPPMPSFVRRDFECEKQSRYRYRCTVPIAEFDLRINHIDHIDAANLSVKEFIERYDKPRKPLIIRKSLSEWNASVEWTIEKLLQKYSNTKFKTSEVTESGKKLKMHFAEYVHYMEKHTDEDPIYLFDPRFGYRAPELLKDYAPLKYFTEDLFQCLGDGKPFYRWLVIGPQRSGSAWHIDPSRTAAWNALLRGRKRWLLYPPGPPPPGVRVGVAKDGGEKYISPTPVKWLLKYYHTALTSDRPPVEVTQEAGETIYVPTGWWHMVLNLETTVAVTQNFANTNNFEDVWADLVKCKSRLVAALQTQLMPFRPDLFRRVGVPIPNDLMIHPLPPNVNLSM